MRDNGNIPVEDIISPLLTNPETKHNCLLQKDPLWYGYSCRVKGCNYFLPVEIFDEIEPCG